jgi:hypothetical protein
MSSEPTHIVFVTGGRQRPGASGSVSWEAYEQAIVLRVDLSTHHVEKFFVYESPPDTCPPQSPSIVFKCGSIAADKLTVCSETEVLTLDLESRAILDYISLPCFNDLHHALYIAEGQYLVANTGLDMIVEVFSDGTNGREWSALGGNPWSRFSRDVDYRRVNTTKPHRSHPNFVFTLHDEIWATRFEQRDAMCLTRANRSIQIASGGPHDGLLCGDGIYFTTVDGHVIEVDATTLKVRRAIDLNAVEGTGEPLGWCRGLFISGDTIWVGFSRLRPTRFRRNVSWLKRGLGSAGHHRKKPTRLAGYSLQGDRLVGEIDLEPHNFNAVFSILPGRRRETKDTSV